MSLLTNDRIVGGDSKGGVGAKMASASGWHICLATRRDLMLGVMSSPLLTSTHLTVTGGLPVQRLASSAGRSSHTPLPSNYSSSLVRAAPTRAGLRSWPVKSCLKISSFSILTIMI